MVSARNRKVRSLILLEMGSDAKTSYLRIMICAESILIDRGDLIHRVNSELQFDEAKRSPFVWRSDAKNGLLR